MCIWAISEVSIHDPLAPRQKYHGRRVLHRKVAQCLAARNREEIKEPEKEGLRTVCYLQSSVHNDMLHTLGFGLLISPSTNTLISGLMHLLKFKFS